MSTTRFRAVLKLTDERASLALPFHPSEVWGKRNNYFVNGSIDGHLFRGPLEEYSTGYVLNLGPAWVRDHRELSDGAEVEVVLSSDGWQIDTIPADIGAAIAADPDAREFFESVASFYRNNYIRWIESARRPETRQRRIAEAVQQLRAGIKRQ